MEHTPIVTLSAGFDGDHLDQVHEALREHLERAGVDGSSGYVMRQVVDELVCNIMEHGSALWIELEVHAVDSDLALTLRDNGKPFDPLSAIQAELPAEPIEDTRHLGLYLVGKLAKDWRYQRMENGVNQLEAKVPLTAEEGVRWSDHRGVRLLILLT